MKMKRLGLLVLIGCISSVAQADPPGLILVGATVHLKGDGMDVYSTGDRVSTVPFSVSGLGVEAFGAPLVLTNRVDSHFLHPGSPYHKVARVKFPTRTLTGYLETSTADPAMDFSSSTLARLQSTQNFYFCTNLFEINQAPFEDTVISTTDASCAQIDPRSFTEVEHFSGPLDGKTKFLGNGLDKDLVKLLIQRPPFFWCQDHGGYNIYWISYNEAVGKNELQPICDRESGELPAPGSPPIPTKEEHDSLIKRGNVFNVSLGWD